MNNREMVLEPGEITLLLEKWRAGDASALEQLVPFVYQELRKLAGAHLRRESSGHTLQPTALVHEVYMRLAAGAAPNLSNRKQFYGVAARQMRQILVDHARRFLRAKRGGGARPAFLPDSWPAAMQTVEAYSALDEALDRLSEVDPRKARAVELRFFLGLEMAEAAEMLSISTMTLHRDLRFATAWLGEQLGLQ